MAEEERQLLKAVYDRTKDVLDMLRMKDFRTPCAQIDDTKRASYEVKEQLKKALRSGDISHAEKIVDKIVKTLEELKQHCCGEDTAECEDVLNKITKEKLQALRTRSANRRERA